MTVISLDQLTVNGVRPPELVEIAARAGYGAISPFLKGSKILPAIPLRAGDPDTIAMARRLKHTGIFINNADGFALFDDVSMQELHAGVALMAEMQARAIVTLQFDSDPARGFDRFCQLREWAQDAGLILLLEFTPLSGVASLADALAYRQRAGQTNIGVLADLFHLHQSGGTPADLAGVDPAILRGAQLCDGPARMDDAEYFNRAMFDRMAPGEGEMPVREFLGVLPPDLIYGVEVPFPAVTAGKVGPLEHATRLLEQARALQPQLRA
jgi:sugar phosphate isomerase/epimerase